MSFGSLHITVDDLEKKELVDRKPPSRWKNFRSHLPDIIESLPILGFFYFLYYFFLGQRCRAEYSLLTFIIGLTPIGIYLTIHLIRYSIEHKRVPLLPPPFPSSCAPSTTMPSVLPHAPSPPITHWMSLLSPSKNLSQIYMPGSHDAATYKHKKTKTRMVSEYWSQCQSNCIFHQLLQGTRFFDIRLINFDTLSPQNSNVFLRLYAKKCRFSGDLWCSHYVPCVPFTNILQDVRRFLNLYPKEIVCISMRGDYPFILDALTRQRIMDTVLSIFSEHQLIRKHETTDPLQCLWDKGKNIICLMEDHDGPEDYFFQQCVWQEGSWSVTHAPNVEQLQEKSISLLKSDTSDETKEKKLLNVLEFVVTPNSSKIVQTLLRLERGMKTFKWEQWSSRGYIKRVLCPMIRKQFLASRYKVILYDYVDQITNSAIICLNFDEKDTPLALRIPDEDDDDTSSPLIPHHCLFCGGKDVATSSSYPQESRIGL